MRRRRHFRSGHRRLARCSCGSACARLSTDRNTQAKIHANCDAETEGNAGTGANANACTDGNARIIVFA